MLSTLLVLKDDRLISLAAHCKNIDFIVITLDVSNLDNGDMSGEHNMAMQTGYYGDNNIPSEAVGLVQYQHQWGDPYYVESENRWDVENHVNVDLGFGGTRQ